MHNHFQIPVKVIPIVPQNNNEVEILKLLKEYNEGKIDTDTKNSILAGFFLSTTTDLKDFIKRINDLHIMKNPCTGCKGLGIFPHYLLESKTSCIQCHGTGKYCVPCSRCNSKGVLSDERVCPYCHGAKYIIRSEVKCFKCDDKGKDKNGNECVQCHGSKKIKAICNKCSGNGHILSFQKSELIQGFYICRVCKGLGRFSDSSIGIDKKILNPVINNDLKVKIDTKKYNETMNYKKMIENMGIFPDNFMKVKGNGEGFFIITHGGFKGKTVMGCDFSTNDPRKAIVISGADSIAVN